METTENKKYTVSTSVQCSLFALIKISCQGKVAPLKGSFEPKWLHTAGAYPGFLSIKQLGVFLLIPGWDASPSQGIPPALCCR